MIPTRGAQGKLLSESWSARPSTLFGKSCNVFQYLLHCSQTPPGTMTSAFPNLFIINGPNTVAPWTSIIHGIEYQAASVARLIDWVME